MTPDASTRSDHGSTSPSHSVIVSHNVPTLNREDWVAGFALAILFVVMLTATWQRWTDPLIDHGREMNVPARLLAGERLYVDIFYHYGPFAPHFNAWLYRVFGTHLTTLYASGIVCAGLILIMIYWLARQLMNPWESALAAGLVLTTCAFSSNIGNYIQPYAYAALYGFTFALAALVCAVRYVVFRRARWMFWAGLCVGGTGMCKPELTALALPPACAAWLLATVVQRRMLWGPISLLVLPALAIGVITYTPIVLSVPWQTLVVDTYEAFSRPQMVYFGHYLDGTLFWPYTGWALVAGVGMTFFLAGVIALMALGTIPKGQAGARGPASRIWALILIGGALWSLAFIVPTQIDVTPLRGSPIVLLAIIVILGYQLWPDRSQAQLPRTADAILLLIAVFGLLSIARVVFNVSLWQSYTPFTVPALIIVYVYLFLRVGPMLLPTSDSRAYARRCATVSIAVIVAVLAFKHASWSRDRNGFEISASRGRLFTRSEMGHPIAEAVRFASARTEPGEYLLSLPQGTIVNFLAERPNPLRDENLVPGLLTHDGEEEAIRRIAARRVRVILVNNQPTWYYRDRTFGVNFNQHLMQWIDANYHPVATFSVFDRGDLQFGDDEFFVRAYERNPE